jgi:general secretion pathway protein A
MERTMLIERFYGLALPPFGLVADPRFFFASRTHTRAEAFLEFGLQQGMGFVVLTGNVGVGKSTVLAHLLHGLPANAVEVASIASSNLDPADILKRALAAFDVPTIATNKADLLDLFETFLDDLARTGRRALLIVDEAQNLPDATLEELRMLTNVQRQATFPFQCFFVGQPQFRARLQQPDMEQFRQRVLASYHVETLNAAEIQDYVEHRLGVAGWQGRPQLDPALYPRIHAMTGGVPRRINIVMNRLLLLGALEERESIGLADLETVLEDLRAEVVGVEPPAPRPAVAGVPGAAAADRLQAFERRLDEFEALLLEVVEITTRRLEAIHPPPEAERTAADPVPIRPVDRRG